MTAVVNFKTRSRVRFENVEKWKGKHAGQSAVLLGNGPSLYDTPLHKFYELEKTHVMFGMNRSWMQPDGEPGYTAPYHIIFGELHGVEVVLRRYEPQFIFTNKSCLKSMVGYNGQVFAVDNRGDWRAERFDWSNLNRGTGAPFAGIYAFQLCAWMGITEIWLVGYDMGIRAHHYKQDSDGFDRSTHVRHFNGVKAWADATGVNIYNTNPESAVHQFEHRELP